jgi:hypothetical protein
MAGKINQVRLQKRSGMALIGVPNFPRTVAATLSPRVHRWPRLLSIPGSPVGAAVTHLSSMTRATAKRTQRISPMTTMATLRATATS